MSLILPLCRGVASWQTLHAAMIRYFPFCTWPVRVACWLIAAVSLSAQEPEPTGDAALQAAAQRAQANPIAPTVTKDMGDVGGKFFGQPPDPAKTRHYYIAAELDAWDFAPNRRDVVCGKPLPAQLEANHVALKLRYFQYTDATFTTRILPTPRLGLLGPVLRGVTGETLAVTFLNKTELPLSMHPHGVKYDKDSEGAYYQPKPGLGAAVAPGATFTYVWHLDEQSGPLPGEPSSKCWLYHSHVRGDEESNLGLVGFIVVTDPKRARPDGTPSDVDREMASLFMIFNESGFTEEDEEAAEAGGEAEKSWAQMQQEREQGNRYAINGYVFGNLPGLEMREGERVRWYLFGLGDENDMHTAHWHGLRVIEEGRRRTDVVELLPATMKVADMLADNAGSWLFHCHVAEHMQEGMFTRVVVQPKAAAPARPDPGAFFGLRENERSLRILRAETTPEGGMRLHGVATAPGAYTVANRACTVQLAGKTVEFKTNATGDAENDGANFRVTNADRFGMVYGELLEFDLILRGTEWGSTLEKLRATAIATPPTSSPTEMSLAIDGLKHTAPLYLREAFEK
jgi:hypothetical protein